MPSVEVWSRSELLLRSRQRCLRQLGLSSLGRNLASRSLRGKTLKTRSLLLVVAVLCMYFFDMVLLCKLVAEPQRDLGA
jgi:hypothetical protein